MLARVCRFKFKLALGAAALQLPCSKPPLEGAVTRDGSGGSEGTRAAVGLRHEGEEEGALRVKAQGGCRGKSAGRSRLVRETNGTAGSNPRVQRSS